jgi:hypothetical protein
VSSGLQVLPISNAMHWFLVDFCRNVVAPASVPPGWFWISDPIELKEFRKYTTKHIDQLKEKKNSRRIVPHLGTETVRALAIDRRTRLASEHLPRACPALIAPPRGSTFTPWPIV